MSGLGESKDLENDSKSVEVSRSSAGCELLSTTFSSTGVRTDSSCRTGIGAESNGSLAFQGGVLTSSSLICGAFPTVIAVAPPAAFSPK